MIWFSFILGMATNGVTQDVSISLPKNQVSELPVVFHIGDQSTAYEALLPKYENLLTICHNDLKAAGHVWGSMLVNIYNLAQDDNINLDGVQLLIHVFWSPEGKIDRLGYYVKPNSKPIKTKMLDELFTKFILTHLSPVQADVPYMNYGVAGFPPLALKITASKQ